jgi:hypothetical protein
VFQQQRNRDDQPPRSSFSQQAVFDHQVEAATRYPRLLAVARTCRFLYF